MSRDETTDGPSFSLYEFKDWMSKQDHSNFFDISKRVNETHEYVGEQVFAKVSKRKLMKKVVAPEEDDLGYVIDDFLEEGGIITEVNGKMLSIEVGRDSQISLPRFCVKIKKTK